MITVTDIVEFVMLKRKKHAFVGWTRSEIERGVIDGYKTKSLAVVFDKNQQIAGIVLGKVDNENKTFHVGNILTENPKGLEQLFLLFIKVYPGYKLTGNRHGKLKDFNIEKLYERFLSKS